MNAKDVEPAVRPPPTAGMAPPHSDDATPAPRAATQRWLQRIGGFTTIPALLGELGADPTSVLAAAGMASDGLSRADASMPYAAFGRLLAEGAARTGCAHFGMLAGSAWHLDNLGLLGTVMRHSPTVGEALATLALHQRVNSQGGVAFVVENGPTCDLGYAIYFPDPTGVTQIYQSVLASAFNFMRELAGPGWLPCEVLLSHPKAADTGALQRFFRAPLRFDSEFCALRFASSWLAQPVQGAEPEMLLAARRALARSQPMPTAGLVEQTSRVLRVLLLQGRSSGDEVARMLSLHRRTLNRRLEQEGTTLREVIDRVRFEIARELLENPRIQIDDIAASLGYSGIGVFMRAFRRWTGTSPGRWRRRRATA